MKAIALFSLLLTTSFAFSQNKNFKLKYEKFTLSNGLEVVLHEDHSDPIVAVATVVHVGSNREKPGKTGFAHFFEHMSFNHSENTPVGANRKLIPEWGGDRNGGTWSDGTIYYEVVPKDAFEKILWIDSDRLGFMINTVTKEALAKEIQVVKNEKRQNNDNVAYGFTNEVILSNLYPKNHPYNWTVIGSLPDLQAATLEDVKEFYEEYYGAGNATLVIAGDIDIAKTKKRVEYWFGEIRKGPEVPKLKVEPVQLSGVKSLYFEDNFAKLPELTRVFPTVRQYHPDAYALDLLGQLLAGTKKSPLYKIIVEDKKLAPGVGISQNSRELAGEFSIKVRANEGSDLDQVKAAVEEALLSFEKNGFTDNQLKAIKAGVETNLYNSISNVLNKAQRMARDNEFSGDPAFLLKAAELTQKVTREDIMRVYQKYIQAKPYVMTSFVPKGKKDLAVTGASEATVWQEKIVQGLTEEDVAPGVEAKFEKTKTKNDRSEPPFGEAPLYKMPKIKETKKGSLATYVIRNDETPLVTFEVTIKGGHAADEISKSGVANLMAQMMTQGTANRTPEELEEAIRLLGASISVTSTNEDIRVRATCLERNFEPTAALVQEILLQPRWDAAEFNRLYKSVQTSIKGREASATTIANLNFLTLLYGKNHILGYPASGVKETVSSITLDDLKNYYSKWIKPSAAAILAVGSITPERVEKFSASLLSAWKGDAPALPSYTASPLKANRIYFIDFPGAKQSVINVGKLTLAATDPDFTKLDFANELLGVGSSGRLTQTLRIGKGYTYGAGSSVQQSMFKAPFVAATSVRANVTLPSLQIIRDLIADYGKTFTEKDASTISNQILKQNTLAYESLNSKLGILRQMFTYKKKNNYIEEDQKLLSSMKAADFRAMIEKYLKEDEMIYVVVGDKATQLPEVKKLGKEVVELDIFGKELAK
jgi:zinc protease